jgi:hypothetical protein
MVFGVVRLHATARGKSMLRASSLHRLIACPYSETIPHVESESGDAAKWGTAVHRYVETRGLYTPPDIGSMKWAKKEKAAGDLATLYNFSSDAPLREANFSWNPLTGDVSRYVGDDWDSYRRSLPFGYITGTADYIELADDHVLVDDLKTGKNKPELAGNPQLLFHASCVTLLFGLPVICSITHWPYYPLAGAPVRHFWAPSIQEILDFRAALIDCLYQLESPWETEPQPSESCFFCPAKPNCAAYKKEDSDAEHG